MLTGIQCDKNIYDGRRSTTQPMEMSSLLAGPGNTTPGTGTLSSGSSRTSNNRVPQFTTNNVVLLQELGEGAFGKHLYFSIGVFHFSSAEDKFNKILLG